MFLMFSRRKFFALLAGAAIAPKGLLASPIERLVLKARSKGFSTAAFDIMYSQTDAAMVFKPKFYYASVLIETTADGSAGFFAQELQRRMKEESDVLA
jgi:hypothetical protein